MPLRSSSRALLGFALLLSLATPVLASAPELHQQLVRIDREIQGAFAALSLGAPPPSAEERRRLTRALLALEGQWAGAAEAGGEEALVEKVRRLRRLVAELEASARLESLAPPAAGKPRPTPLVRAPGSRGLDGLAPGNDLCGDATALTLGSVVTGSLAGATHDGQASCGSSLFANDVWYRFDPPDYGYYSLDSLGSNFDTVLSVHEGCPGSLQNEQVCNDDGLGLASALSFYGYPGTPLWIRVAGYGGDLGLYQLQVGTGGTVTGLVQTADTLTPRPGVHVRLYRAGQTYSTASATTGADGRYTFAAVGAGLYRVWADALGDYLDTPHGGCPDGADSCSATDAPTVEVGSNGTVTGVDILQRRGAAIVGRVTLTNGTAFPAVTLIAWNPAIGDFVLTADSDAGGNYRLAPLPSGSFTVYTDETGAANEAWPNISCDGEYYCGTRGQPIAVTSPGTVPGIDFVLDRLGSLSGRVTDAATGVPVASAEIQLYTAGGSWVGYQYTDAGGNFSLSGLSPGSYRALATGPYSSDLGNELFSELPCGQSCNVAAGTAIAVALNATTPNVNFTLPHLGTLSGRVTSAGGSGLGSIWLRLYSAQGWSARSVLSDANGNYAFSGLEAGSYFLRTENSFGWLDELFDDHPCGPLCDVTGGTPIAITDGQNRVANFSLGPGAVISGALRETGSGAALSNGTVQLWDAAGLLVKSIQQPVGGNYSFTGLAAGTYYLTTDDHPNHQDELYDNLPCEGSCNVLLGTPVVLGPSGSLVRNFSLDRQGAIEGFVLPAGGGTPLAFWGVDLYSSAGQYLRSVSTQANGFYHFEGLVAGGYRLRTHDFGVYVDELYPDVPCEPNCLITAGQVVQVTLGTTVGVSFGLLPFGHIQGTVRNQASGAGLSSASVEAIALGNSSQYGHSFTQSDGTYDLAVAPGTYRLQAFRSGFVAEQWQERACGLNPYGEFECDPAEATPVVVAAGGTVTGIDFTLEATGSLSGSVTDTSTGAAIDSQIRVWTAAGTEVGYDYTDQAGFFSVGGLPPGTYFLTSENYEGYIDELWSDLPCLNGPPYGCKVRRGLPIAVLSGATTRNLHLRLERFGGATGTGLAGQVVDGLTGEPLVGVTIDAWSLFGQHRGSAVTGPNGSYRLALSTGDYFVSTDNGLGYLNQIWPSLPCPGGSAYSGACSATNGTVVTVPATGGVHFELQPPAAIFSDGFESGNFTAWSVVVP